MDLLAKQMADVQSASRLQTSQSIVTATKFVCKAQEGETSAVKRQNERETGEKGEDREIEAWCQDCWDYTKDLKCHTVHL